MRACSCPARWAAPFFLLPLGVLSLPAAAATFTVTHDGASGPGSFRQAMADAAAVPAGTTAEIEFDAEFFAEPRRVVLDRPLPMVRRSLVIKGPEPAASGEPGVVLSGDANGSGVVDPGDVSGLFVEVPSGGLLSVQRVGFSGFRNTAYPGAAVGFRPSGPARLVLEQCVFSGNQARWGGAVSVPGEGHEVSVRECLFAGNRAEEAEGGAMYFEGSPALVEACVFRGNSARAGGAVFTSHGAVELRGCWFENNEARGMGEGGAVSARRGLRVSGSTFSGNRARAGGALFLNQMLAPAPGALIENSTFSGNVAAAASGGALYAVSTQAVIRHCTITLNHANESATDDRFAGGGGIAVPEAANINRIELHNSVVADNRRSGPGPADAVDLMGPPASFRSLGGNVVGVGGPLASVLAQPGDASGSVDQPLNAKLGPLGNNGGPLPTHLPDPESPVVDAGVPGTGEGLALDQRGLPRPGGPAPDAGAVELVTLGYADWAGHFMANQGAPSPAPGQPPVLSPAQDPEADPDGDGVPNVREYLIGSDPLRPSGDALVRVVPDPAAGGLAVRYLMASHVVPGTVEVSFDVSASLEAWLPVVPTPPSREVARSGSVREMEVILPGFGGPGYFVRLSARLADAGGD